MDRLLITNNTITDDDVYVYWRNDRETLKIFGYMLNSNIYVSGFVSDDINLQGVKIFNKRICSRDEIGKKSTIVEQYFGIDQKLSLCKINHNIHKDVFIFGAGYVGDTVYKILRDASKKVLAYIDTDFGKIGQEKNGIPICDVNILHGKNVDEYSLIIATDKYQEIEKMVNLINPAINRFYWDTDDGGYVWIDKDNHNIFDWHEINELCYLAQDKKIYIYGAGEDAHKIEQCLQLMDFKFGGYLVNEDTHLSETSPVMFVEEILYEKDYFIIVIEDVQSSIQKLTELGLKFAIDFVPIHPLVSNTFYSRKNILDMNLGHSFVNHKGEIGFYKYYKKTDKYIIAVLGGSTTDGGCYPFQSWSEILHEKFQEVTVYNFGVSGYTSTQELIKLVRDVLDLKPNMVIVYDGCNDSVQKDNNYFSFPYLRDIFEFSEKRIEGSWWWMASREHISNIQEGEHVKDYFDMWLSNIRIMREICRMHEIQFFSFLQPLLPCKKELDKKETAILLLYSLLDNEKDKYTFDFDARIRQQHICEQYNYIYNLSDIFDNIADVYMDICHVTEHGNQIIANEIYKKIEKTVMEDLLQYRE